MNRKLTGRGIAVSHTAIALLLVGLLTRDGALITLGSCGLMLVAGCFVLAPLNLRGLELRVRLPPRIFAAQAVTVQMDLLNKRRVFDAWAVEATVRFPHATELSGSAAWTSAQGTSVIKRHLHMPGRAVLSELSWRLRSSFPLGFFELSLDSVSSCQTLVYPRLIEPEELHLDALQPGDPFGEPRGIRPYQPGDKAARIHQFASAHSIARGQGLQVRVFDPPGFYPDGCRVVFHSFSKSGQIIRLDRFERALSLVAGTLAHFQGHPARVRFQADFNDWRCCPCQTRGEYLECLALLARAKRKHHTSGRELAEILRNTSAREQWIIISDSPAANWADLVPAHHADAILVDIRQVRFKKRQMRVQPIH